MKTMKLACAFAGALALGGCFEQPLFMKGAGTLSTATTAAVQAIDASSATATYDERMRLAIQASGSGEVSFAEFACAGIGTYAAQRAAVGYMTGFSGTVARLTAPPSDDFGKLWASVNQPRMTSADHPASADVAREVRAATEACQNLITEAMGRLDSWKAPRTRPLGVPTILAVPPATIAAVEALAVALEKAAVVILQQVDIERRTIELKRFLDDSGVRAAIVATLGQCALHTQDPARIDECLAVNSQNALSDAMLLELRKNRVAATIALAKTQFDVIGELPKTSARDRARIVQGAVKISANLQEFDALRRQKPPAGLQKALISAYLNLQRIRDDKLTDAERRVIVEEAVKRLIGFGKALKDAVNDVADEAEKARKALQSLDL